MQLTDYIMRYTVLDKTTCKDVIQQLDKEEWSKHTFVDYDDNFDDEIQKSPCLTLTKPTPVDKIVMDSLYDAIHEYVTIKGMPFFTKWAGYSNVKYNKYGVGNQMEKHADHIYSIFRNNAGIPKGIPTTVRHKAIPPIMYSKAIIQPPNTIQIIFPIKLILVEGQN